MLNPWIFTLHMGGYIWYVHVFTPPLLKSDFMYTRKELNSGSQFSFSSSATTS